MIYQSAENDSIVRGESMDILNGNRRVLNVKLPFGSSNRIVRCGKSRRARLTSKRQYAPPVSAPVKQTEPTLTSK
jgi:hypothetical protein